MSNEKQASHSGLGSGYYDPADFPFTKVFEENYEMLKEEFLGLKTQVLEIQRNGPHEQYVRQLLKNNGWTPSWQVGTTDPNFDWLTYGLCYMGKFPDEVEEKLPGTTKLLRSLLGYKVCAFSRMRPTSHIAPHTHPELGGEMLTYHLGITLEPRMSHLWVDGEFREQKECQSLIFDGSREHFAVNMSSSDRVIFYMEFHRESIGFL